MEKEKNNSGTKKTASDPDDEQVIEGGEITNLDDSKVTLDAIEKHKLTTARWLAYALVTILAGSFVIHYGMMAWLASQDKTAALEIVESTFSAWLPVISGLAGAVVTYFFTRENNLTMSHFRVEPKILS
jgi:hypothetical protein